MCVSLWTVWSLVHFWAREVLFWIELKLVFMFTRYSPRIPAQVGKTPWRPRLWSQGGGGLDRIAEGSAASLKEQIVRIPLPRLFWMWKGTNGLVRNYFSSCRLCFSSRCQRKNTHPNK
jgi:hypothetical protein